MMEQIVYNIIMGALLLCWVVTNYFMMKYDNKDSEVRQTLFQTMCLVALIGHNLFFIF